MSIFSTVSSTVAMTVAGAALTATIAAGGWAMWQSSKVSRLETENAGLALQLGACNARIKNIMEDKDSDTQVDNMPNLRDIPDHWLLP